MEGFLLQQLELLYAQGPEPALLERLVERVKNQPSTFVQSLITGDSAREWHFTSVIRELQTEGYIEITDDTILPKTKQRSDIAPLRLQKLRTMADVEFLVSLHGCRLPFTADCSPYRGPYEDFFEAFLQKLLRHEKYDTAEGFVFLVLKETLYMLDIITEFTVDFVEFMIHVNNIYVPFFKDLRFAKHLTHKLLQTDKQNQDPKETAALAIESYDATCKIFIKNMHGLQLREPPVWFIRTYCVECISFVNQFQHFIHQAMDIIAT